MGAVGHDVVDPFLEDRLKLRGVQMPPLALLTGIVTEQLLLAARSTKLCPMGVPPSCGSLAIKCRV